MELRKSYGDKNGAMQFSSSKRDLCRKRATELFYNPVKKKNQVSYNVTYSNFQPLVGKLPMQIWSHAYLLFFQLNIPLWKEMKWTNTISQEKKINMHLD